MITDVSDIEPEDVKPLSVGIVYDWSPAGGKWREAATALGRAVIAARGETESDLNVNVVFHIGGRRIEPEFVGVRTGRYSKRLRLLMVQAAVPSSVVADQSTDPESTLRALLISAVEEADEFARRRGLASQLDSLHALATTV